MKRARCFDNRECWKGDVERKQKKLARMQASERAGGRAGERASERVIICVKLSGYEQMSRDGADELSAVEKKQATKKANDELFVASAGI